MASLIERNVVSRQRPIALTIELSLMLWLRRVQAEKMRLWLLWADA